MEFYQYLIIYLDQIDYYNLKLDKFGNEIIYPPMLDDKYAWCFNNDKAYGCAIAHYQAVLQAYEFGYNNVLIIEDDICFIKDKKLIEYYINNIPDEIDFLNYTARFDKCEIDKFKLELQANLNNDYMKISSKYKTFCGGIFVRIFICSLFFCLLSFSLFFINYFEINFILNLFY